MIRNINLLSLIFSRLHHIHGEGEHSISTYTIMQSSHAYIMSMVKEVTAQETTNMSMTFQASRRYEPGWRITP